MTPHPAVLLGLRPRERELRAQLEGWVQRLGYQTRFTADADEAIAWMGDEAIRASFLDCDMERAEGQAIWRTLRPTAARRVVLMAPERRRDLWFEALRSGMATVLPLPPREPMVRAALLAVAGRLPVAGGGWAPEPRG
jgi:DNA-binding NtrC family response regulator